MAEEPKIRNIYLAKSKAQGGDGDITKGTKETIGDFFENLDFGGIPGAEKDAGVGAAADLTTAVPLAWTGDPEIINDAVLNKDPSGGTSDHLGTRTPTADTTSTLFAPHTETRGGAFDKATLGNIIASAKEANPKSQFPIYDALTTAGEGSGYGDISYAKTPPDSSNVSLLQTSIMKNLQKNRFNPTPGTSPYIEGQSTKGVIATVQRSLGRYIPASDNPGAGESGDITFDQLRTVGERLLVAGTGHTDVSRAPDTIDDDGTRLSGPQGGIGTLLLPSSLQLGFTKVNLGDVRPAQALSDVFAYGEDHPIGSKPEITDSTITADGDGLADTAWGSYQSSTSYGHLNSNLEPFDGPFLGMIVLTITGFIGLALIATIISWSMRGSGVDVGTGSNDANPLGRNPAEFMGIPSKAGHFIPPGSGGGVLLKQMFGIPELRHGWNECYVEGINAFFGFADAFGCKEARR